MTVTRKLRPLNQPGPVSVEADEAARPTAVIMSRRRLIVEAHHETWRIDDEWWRPKPVSRTYWRVSLEDGRVVDIYRDLTTGRWFRQAYG